MNWSAKIFATKLEAEIKYLKRTQSRKSLQHRSLYALECSTSWQTRCTSNAKLSPQSSPFSSTS
jgi:hypothetical protein